MTRPYKPIDVSAIRTGPAVGTTSPAGRGRRTTVAAAASLPAAGASAAELLASMPDYLGVSAFRKVVDAVVQAVRHDRPVVTAFGAHVIKVGCGPILIDLIQRGIVKAISANGACAIHDVELAMLGETSEDVAKTIRDGTFGMDAETFAFFDEVATLTQNHRRPDGDRLGLGAAVGRLIVERDLPFRRHSVFAAAYEASIPACVHVALGTDTVHMSPKADGAALGAATMHDFRLICDVVSDLGADTRSANANPQSAGGVWLNIGSAVLLPEVFLKAVSVARNLGANLDRMTTANFDMIRHYRPHQNVVIRPVAPGYGHELIGHHEIMLPLFRQAVVEALNTGP